MTGVETSAPVTFYMANVPKLMQHVMANCTGYSALVDKACKEDPTVCFDLVVYNDEATGGNLLQPDTSKKASLWYFALRQVQWLWTDVTWHPLCLIQHTEFDKALGGFSAIVLRIIRELEEQNLAVGFPCTFPGGKSILKCQVKWIISDLDSIRGALSLKGSSAMRCCMFCRNVIKKHAGVTDYDDYFQDITSSKVDQFDPQTDQDIFDVWDDLAEKHRRLPKATFGKSEIAAGFHYSAHALLSDKYIRELLPPSSFLLDVMHLFWANGVVSWEVNAAYQRWQETKMGNLNEFLSLPWCFPTTGNTKSWRQGLGHESNFQGVSYKGSASNLQFFFPIFHYFLEGCVGRNGSMQEELKSMRALRRVTLEQRVVSHQAQPSMDKLIRLNVEHQHLTKAVYGYDAIRPKHHVRFHQPLQHFRAGFYVDCFPCEEKHKMFKSHIGLHRFDPWAKSSKGEYSHLVAKQIWVHHLESLKDFNFTTGHEFS